jgi:hypothetical protein
MNVADVASRTEMLGHGDPLGRDDQRPWRDRLMRLRRIAIRTVNTPVALPFMTRLSNGLTSFAFQFHEMFKISCKALTS